MLKRKSSFHYLLTWLVIIAQIFAFSTTAMLGAIQPTPQMAQDATQQAGFGDWFAAAASHLTAAGQRLWGTPASAKASALPDTSILASNQIQSTVHPEENMVVNSSFEMSPIIANGTGSRVTGWTILAGNIDIWNWWTSPDASGRQLHLSGDQTGAISQTVTGLEPGQSYFFEFDYTSETGSQSARVQLVNSSGTNVISQTVTSPGRPDGPGWSFYRNTFTAPADGQVAIRFTQTSPVPNTTSAFTIDDVRIAKRLTNYVTNGSFEGGRIVTNATTDIPGWRVSSGNVDIYNAYFRPDGSTRYLYVNGNTPGTISQTVTSLTASQLYFLDFEYASEGNISTQALVTLLDSAAATVLTQTVTSPSDANNRGWQHFRTTFAAPGDGIVTLRLNGITAGSNGLAVDNVRISAKPLNWVANGDFESGPTALNIASTAVPSWTVVTGPVDLVGLGLLYNKAVDLNGTPGNGKLEQTVTGLTAGEVYAFQVNYASNGNETRYATIRLLDSGNTALLNKRVACDHDYSYQGWCTLRHSFTAPADGIVKVVLENDETDGNTSYGIMVDNVSISDDLNFVINGNFSSGATGLNQSFVPGWSITDYPDVHDGYGGSQYRFAIELNGTPGSVTARQNLSGLTPGQSYTLRYLYASSADSINAQFSAQVLPTSGAALIAITQSTGLNGVVSTSGWREARHTFTAPADGQVSILFRDIESDGNTSHGAFIDNVSLFGATTVTDLTLDVCSTSAPAPVTTAPGGVTDGLRFWIRGDAAVYNNTDGTAAIAGDQVKRWADRSGYGLDVVPDNGHAPTYRAGTTQTNYNPYLDFLDDYLGNYSQVMPVYSDVTMLGVGFKSATGGIDTILSTGENGNDPTLDVTNLDFNPWSDASSPAYVTHVGSPITQNRMYLFDMRARNGVSNDLVAGLSGRDHANNMEILGANDLYMFRKVNIGSDSGGEDWDGGITENIIYSRALTGTELARVRSYLAIRNGLTLDADPSSITTNYDYLAADGTTIIWPGTSNIAYRTYHNDVTGIGRDDASDLDQRKSISVNGDDPVTIDNGGAFTADNSFLVWGNNNGAASFTTSYTPDGFSPTSPLYRAARIWRVQESGTVGTVLVSINNSAEYMVVDTDGDGNFATGTQDEIAISAGSFSYDFDNNDFFTFVIAQRSPGGVTGHDLWVKANESGCNVGVACTAWEDHSENDNAIETAGVMLLQDADSAHNYNPYFGDFNSNNHFWDTTSSLNATNGGDATPNHTVFSVVRPRSSNGTGRVIGIDNDTPYAGEPGFSLNAGNPYAYRFSGTIDRSHPNDAPINESSVLSWRTNDTALDISLNSTVDSSTITDGGLYGQHLRLGYGTWSAAGAFPGDIMEVIWYKETLTNTQRQQVESYLAIKYGVTLSATNYLASDGSTIVWNSTTNSAYHNDVAGIGRDDGSDLEQIKSKSVNSDDPIIIDNGGVFTASKSFLMWGNNSNGISLTANYNGGSNNRLARVWKVQETGAVGAVKVILPRSAASAAGLRSIIVHASDATFATQDRGYPLTVRGGNYEATVNFNNGDFFTFSSSSTISEIDVTPGSIDFGTVNAGSTSPAQAVTIQNLGDVNLSISSISLSGSDAAQFAISSNNCGATLSAGASCTVQLTLTPASSGAKSTLLVISSSDSDEGTTNIALTGTAPDAAAALDRYNLAITKSASVSNATPGTSFTYTLTAFNKGTVTASNVVATDQLPAGVTFNSATATNSGNCTHSSGTVTCTWASLANGASATAIITVTR